MPTTVRSFAKINLGLHIGAPRPDGFHELRTVYQTIGLHDQVSVSVGAGAGIELHCAVAGVPLDRGNTCWRMVERAMGLLGAPGRVRIEIEKKLPIQGGLGGASSNAVAALLALQRELGRELPLPEQLRLAAEVGSDLPLFLLGGTVLGVGRGEEVYPLPEFAPVSCVLAAPDVAVSTPQAFADWDRLQAKLTVPGLSDRINEFSSAVFLGWNSVSRPNQMAGRFLTGVPAEAGGGRAETLLLDLVRTGMANDFEKVVFSQHPELAEVKRALHAEGAMYASLSGSGSAVFGLFDSRERGSEAAAKLQAAGIRAYLTATITRSEYWRQLFA